MKKNIFNILLALIPLMALLSSCNKEDIVFDHELPQFEIRDDAILLEVIMPQGTAVDDKLYISGDFNGGDEEAMTADWMLEKASGNDIKWGIYLYPNTFKNGKTLADGFHFISEKQGVERTVFNEDAVHTLNVEVGTRTNVTADRWNAYFEDPDKPVTHDGYVVYVIDETGWNDLALYAWGSDLPELFGGWPGVTPTGTQVINGVTYKYFDTGAANTGLTYNLIFNSAAAGTQFDGPGFTLDHDIYLKITSSGYEELGEAPIAHDGYAIFIEDNTGWDEITMYAWGSDLPELFGGWPGVLPTGEQTINGVTYKYFDTGAANVGLTYNLILNSNGSGNQFDLAGVTLDRDYYFSCTASKGTEIDPNNPGTEPDPTPDPEPTTKHKIYVADYTGWTSLNLYSWGVSELFGGWPGAQSTGTETIGGVVYSYFEYEGTDGTYNLIFNNGTDQLADFPIAGNKDYYLSISSTGVTELDPPEVTMRKIK